MEKENNNNLGNKNVQIIAVNAIIVAVIAVMSFVPYVGYIGIPAVGISITTIHIAVLLFAWLFGWRGGLVAGLSFGVFSLIRAAAMPNTIIDPYFLNPLVSVFPRLLFGFLSGLAFDLLKFIKKPKLRFLFDVVVCGVGTLFHSFLTLTILFSVAGNKEALEGFTYTSLILTMVSINGLIELATALVIVPLLILPLDKAFPKYEAIYHGTLRSRKKATVYDTITLNTHKDLFENLGKFVAINSVYDEKTVNKENPFGKGVSKALKFITDLAKADGFEAKNYENKVVEILCGEGKNITILAHADVVPAGTGWDQDPFSMVDHGDYLTGRGVADDKGPLLAAYYAMKAVRDNHMLGNYQIRFIVGGNEESGSAGVEYYFQKLKKEQPNLGFSPDAEYPLIFAEKGILNFEVKKKFAIPHVHSIVGGVASNSVIEKCVVTMNDDPEFIKYLEDHNYKFTSEKVKGGHLEVTFIGKAAHGAVPEEGINAGMMAVEALGQYYTNKDLLHLFAKYSNLQGYGIEASGISEDMGHNSLNVGLLKWEDKQLSMTVNFRYVDTCHLNDLKIKIKELSKPFAVNFLSESKLLFYPRESVLVQTLLRAYQEETGDYESKPKAIGGGTYAKEADNVVAFGMEMPGWDSKMHSPGEQVRKADLIKSISIYAKAIVELGKKLEGNEN